MIVIGVTGGVGTGKSTIARVFAEHLHAQVLDADRITHQLMRPRTAVWCRIRARFGKQVLARDGSIDRKKLGALAFGRPARIRELSRIIHPAVRRRIRERLQKIRRRNPNGAAVLDIPLLLEAGVVYRVDALVVASASLSVAARRLKSRSGWSLVQVKKRQSFQMPLRKKEQLADFVVKNSGSLAATRRQVATICRQIIKEKG